MSFAVRQWPRHAARTVAIAGCAAMGMASTSGALSTAVSQIRSVYRTVLIGEYFGPASRVCSHLTASGVRSYTAGGFASCSASFKASQHTLRHKMPDVDDSGYTPRQWKGVVNNVMGHLKVRVHGSRATAIGGQSGIPGQTTLVLAGGNWRFSSYPPSIES